MFRSALFPKIVRVCRFIIHGVCVWSPPRASWKNRPRSSVARLRNRLSIRIQIYEYTNSGKCQFERSKKSRPFLRIFLILDIFLTKKTHTTTVKTIFEKLNKTSYLWDFWWFVTAQIGICPSLWIHISERLGVAVGLMKPQTLFRTGRSCG